MEFKIIYTEPGDENFGLFEQVVSECYSPVQVKLVMNNISPQYFHTALVIIVDGKPVGRCAIYNNESGRIKGGYLWCIGNYECINNSIVSKQLLDAAFRIIHEQGGKYVIGPMNASTWDNYRFSSDNTNLFFTESYHHTYYNDQFIKAGFSLLSAYFSAVDTQLVHNTPKVLELEKKFLREGIVIRSMNLGVYEQELKKIYPFVTEAFSTNFLYTPIDENYFMAKYLPLQKFLDPDFVLVAENKKGETVGVFMAVDDVYATDKKQLIIKTIARKNDESLRGLGHVMGDVLYRNAVKRGYTSMVHAFMSKTGTSVNTSNYYSGKLFKEYALYGKEI